MASDGHEAEDLVILVLTDSLDSHRVSIAEQHGGIACISISNIQNWDLPSILRSHVIKVEATRSRLAEKSSYFRGLLQGCFSESTLEQVSIEWNLEGVIGVLSSIYECSYDITPNNFLLLLEAAFFFGVEALLLQCEAWFSDITSAERGHSFPLSVEATNEIWNFSVEHSARSIQERCSSYFAQNFMQVRSSRYFADIPYQLFSDCIDDPHLTVNSEKELCDTILDWIRSNERQTILLTMPPKDYTKILEKIRIHLLPLGYAAGKRIDRHFSQTARKSVSVILDMVKHVPDLLPTCCPNDASELDDFRIRISKFSEIIDLQGCSQLTTTLLFLSLLPPLPKMDSTGKKMIAHSLSELHNHGNVFHDPPWPMCFDGVRHVDMSDCPMLQADSVVKLMCLAFPRITVLRLSHNSNFEITHLYNLMQRCPMIKEVDLTVDISPLSMMQTTILSVTSEEYKPLVHIPCAKMQFLANIKRLTVEGRTDLNDRELSCFSRVVHSLCYINIRGCTSLTDVGIASLLCHNTNINSIIASHTSFGGASISVLCSNDKLPDGIYGATDKNSMDTIASRLQQLAIDNCKGIDHVSMQKLFNHLLVLRVLTAKDTCLLDDALDQFKGSFLEKLDISETLISTRALIYIVQNNPNMKVLQMSSCKNLHSSVSKAPKLHAIPFENLSHLLGQICQLNEIAFGWGFSSSSLAKLIPAMKEVKCVNFGIGSSLDDQSLSTILKFCPLLESVTLCFQVISDSSVRMLSESLKNLQVLNLHCCLGDLTSESFQMGMYSLRTLKLEWVARSMKNNDLVILTQNCPNLLELKLSGCKFLDPESQEIISKGWPGLTYLHLEECGDIMRNGSCSIFDCKGLEDLLLRHCGQGMKKNFIADAALKLPLLRKLALDICDACEGGFDSPSYTNRCFLSIVKIARCKPPRCSFGSQRESYFGAVHHKTIVLTWNNKEQRTVIVKERL